MTDRQMFIGLISAAMIAVLLSLAIHERSHTTPATTHTTPATMMSVLEVEDCYENGNLVCGDPDDKLAGMAWQAWDELQGWRHLRVDPNRSFKVDYVGMAQLPPRLGSGEVALPAGEGYWVFRAQYDTP